MVVLNAEILALHDQIHIRFTLNLLDIPAYFIQTGWYKAQKICFFYNEVLFTRFAAGDNIPWDRFFFNWNTKEVAKIILIVCWKCKYFFKTGENTKYSMNYDCKKNCDWGTLRKNWSLPVCIPQGSLVREVPGLQRALFELMTFPQLCSNFV